MPEYQIDVNDDEKKILEQIQMQQGLDSIEEAAEWLAKQRLLRQTRNFSGRGRALVLIQEKKK